MQGVRSGFNQLDSLLGGFKSGQFIVLAARPAMGKTSFALNIAFNAAMYQDLKVGIFTMEMDSEEILLRILSSASEVNMKVLQKGIGMTQEKLQKLTQVATGLNDTDHYTADRASTTMFDIRSNTRRLKAQLGDLDLILIDYLQLMILGKRVDSRQQEISEISRSLKILAKELKIPVIALSQLNRALESRDDKRPKLSDLRESGAIEQDADVVMFIYRDDYYNKEDSKNPGIAEILIKKNRHGPVGEVELQFIEEITGFRNKEDEF